MSLLDRSGTLFLLEEPVVVAQHELTVDLAHQFECHTHGDENGGSGERERLDVAHPQDDVRQDGNGGRRSLLPLRSRCANGFSGGWKRPKTGSN